ncbi:uncharacterized protein IL334_001463 [Kwoniella shivajii]|uniref:AB hydrolase-1 domain-containing protein n=1 Tax=Kwoniella shivajii TaxID=564305 RepID=A0ABZ1CS87_9TREE|nr:hypothetical protein IL334_001463 [Kwoniella shivajii]
MGRTFTSEPSNWVHGKVEVSPGIRLHYVDVKPLNSNGTGKGKTIVLIHGFPLTWYSWRHVIQPLSELGLRVLAVDYRGAGDSDRPRYGYDKITMSKDIHTFYKKLLGENEKPIICGKDIGSMVASNLALQFEDDIEALITFEAPIPGTETFDKVTTDPKSTYNFIWHFFFHFQADLPEMLIQGKEKEYISHFFRRLSHDPSFLTDQDLEVYTKAFASSGGMRAGLDTYRTFPQNIEDFRGLLEKNGKVKVPTLTMAGSESGMKVFIEDQTREYAQDVSYKEVPNCSHYIFEENPDGWMKVVEEFLKDKKLL